MLQKFKELFCGLDVAYGEYYLNGERDTKTGKEKGRATTKRGPVTDELFQRHLNGEINLGIIPIRSDNTCTWGCIDVDKYDIDFRALIKQIRQKKYPLVPYRSKSGGLHLFIHTREAVTASDMIDKLHKLAADLGLSGCEIFPKQRKIMVHKNDLGNWLNIPYQQAARTTRHAIHDNGMGIPINEFFSWVEKYRISGSAFRSIKIESDGFPLEGEFDQFPPCLQALIRNGCADGFRNNALTGFATLAKKRNPEGWQKEVWERNEGFTQPLADREVQALISQYEKKEYQYKCNDAPLKNHCNSAICKTLKYGIDSIDYMPTMDSFQVLKTKPPIYFLTIDKKTVELTGKQLNQQQLLSEQLFDQADIVWQKVKDKDYRVFLNKLKTMQQPIEGYDESNEAEEEFKDTMIQFTQETQQADNASQVEAEMWYLHEGLIVFKYRTFERFIKKSDKAAKKFEIISMLKKNGCTKHDYYDKLKLKYVWLCRKVDEPVIERSNIVFKRRQAPFEKKDD